MYNILAIHTSKPKLNYGQSPKSLGRWNRKLIKLPQSITAPEETQKEKNQSTIHAKTMGRKRETSECTNWCVMCGRNKIQHLAAMHIEIILNIQHWTKRYTHMKKIAKLISKYETNQIPWMSLRTQIKIANKSPER